MISGDSYKTYAPATRTLSNLWDGRREIVMEALHSEHARVASAAMRTLALSGDDDAVVAIRQVLADTSASLEVRKEAAVALSRIHDQASIPIIESVVSELGADIGPDGRCSDGSILSRLYQYQFEQSLQRLERPDLARPLVQKGEHFIRYRFLLDDIASISVVKDSFWGFPPELARAEQRQVYVLPKEDQRRICDLLQDGTYEYPGMISEGLYLVITLVDGREVAMVKNGEIFCLSTGDHAWADPFCVRATDLAAYVDAVLSSERDSSGEKD
jgi:hypothetical protein